MFSEILIMIPSFLSDFVSNFVRKNENKRVFYPYFVDEILEKAKSQGFTKTKSWL